MANAALFRSTRGRRVPKTDTVNLAGGTAYSLSAKAALAQLAATGTLNQTYYATADDQLEKVLELASRVEPLFVAKTAIYAREKAFMKDMPALLLAVLAAKDVGLLAKVFPRVIDTTKMLRTFVQIVRSGVTGRKSLGTRPKKLILNYLSEKSPTALFKDSVGTNPSLADILKMVHPKPSDETRRNLYAYLIGRDYSLEMLPKLVRDFEVFKQTKEGTVPAVPFQMLTALNLGTAEWTEIARNASWTQTRLNLNTFARHGVFSVKGMPELIAARLRDPDLVKKAKVFPYQLMVAYTSVGSDVPREVKEALQDAMEIATENVPAFPGKVYVFPDVSGSMSSAATGYRKGATSVVRCIDVAALFASTILRKNPTAEVIPFEGYVVPLELNPRDSVMTNAEKLASIGGGSTNCAAPLALLNERKAQGDLCIFVSDNQSWVGSNFHYGGTGTMTEWRKFQSRNPTAKMVCIDIAAYTSTQAPDSEDILNIGSFSDRIFDVVQQFVAGGLDADHWISTIEAIEV